GRPCGIEFSSLGIGPGGAMADSEQADGALEALEPVPGAKGKLKLMIAVVGLLAVVGGGSAIWFFCARHAGDEMHAEAEAPPRKPPAFVDVPDMLVNLIGAPGERVQYLKVKV